MTTPGPATTTPPTTSGRQHATKTGRAVRDMVLRVSGDPSARVELPPPALHTADLAGEHPLASLEAATELEQAAHDWSPSTSASPARPAGPGTRSPAHSTSTRWRASTGSQPATKRSASRCSTTPSPSRAASSGPVRRATRRSPTTARRTNCPNKKTVTQPAARAAPRKWQPGGRATPAVSSSTQVGTQRPVLQAAAYPLPTTRPARMTAQRYSPPIRLGAGPRGHTSLGMCFACWMPGPAPMLRSGRPAGACCDCAHTRRTAPREQVSPGCVCCWLRIC